MHIIAVLGFKGRGKTLLIERLTSNLSSEGFRVATIKHTHGPLDLDKRGKDTWRLWEAGSIITIGISENELFLRETIDDVSGLDKALSYMRLSNVHIVFIEGFKEVLGRRDDVFKIIISDNCSEALELLRQIKPPILAVISKEKCDVSKYNVTLNIRFEEFNTLIDAIKNLLLKVKR